MFSFNFKCMKDITFPFVDSHFIDKLDYEQPDKLFADNNFDSGSAFYNHYGFAKTLLFIFFANLIFLAIKLITVLFKFNKKCLKKTLKWFSGLFHFSIYLRICIEAILFIFISFILELSQFDSFEGHKVSYIITWVSLLVITILVILLPIHFFVFRTGGKIRTKFFSELYNGTKDKPLWKLNTLVFIIRRLLWTLVVVLMRNTDIWSRTIVFTCIQILALAYSVFIRPFQATKDTIIDIINELSFTFICMMVTVCNEEQRWFKTLSQVLIYFLMCNWAVTGLVTLVYTIISCIKKCRKDRYKRYIQKQVAVKRRERTLKEEHPKTDETFKGKFSTF